jgi:hypothetical protein
MAFCTRCGKEVDAHSAFCPHCGQSAGAAAAPASPLNATYASSEDEFRAFVGPNSDMYLPRFKIFSLFGRDKFALTWNWPALLFGSAWAFYRKMYLLGIVSFIMRCIPILGFIFALAMGVMGNYLYYMHARAKIFKIKATVLPEQRELAYSSLGGVHDKLVWIFPIFYLTFWAVLFYIFVPV